MIQEFIIQYKQEIEKLKRQNNNLIRKLENQRRNKLRLKNNLNQIIKEKNETINKLLSDNKNNIINKDLEITNLKKDLSLYDSCWEWDTLDNTEINE